MIGMTRAGVCPPGNVVDGHPFDPATQQGPQVDKAQYDKMVFEGLGELDKSGIAELTFKDRHKHSGDRV